MAKPACKCKATECEECPEWIFTFADLVMLMMGFFVILWVLKPAGEPKKDDAKSMAQQEEWLNTVGEIRGGFGYEPNPSSNDPVDQQMVRKRQQVGAGMGGKTNQAPKGADGTDRETQSIRPGKHAIMGTRVQFQAGKTDLSLEGKHSLDDIVKLIQGHRQIFVVKGHASLDDFIDAGGAKADPKQLAQDRMNLSVRRAQVVADYLTAMGVDPEVMRVQGCSTFEPIVQRAYSDNLNVNNRRVEVESSDSPVSERQEGAKTSTVLPPGLKIESAATSVEPVDHN